MSYCLIQQTTLQAIADALREKINSSNVIPVTEFAPIIKGLNALNTDVLVFGPNCSNLFSGNSGLAPFLESYGAFMDFKSITNCRDMFSSGGYRRLNNLTLTLLAADACRMFSGCSGLITLPKVSGSISNLEALFKDCEALKGDDFEEFFKDLTYQNSATYAPFTQMFTNCKTVRDLSYANNWLHTNLNAAGQKKDVNYSELYYGCKILDTLENVPTLVDANAETSNIFDKTFNGCNRIKDVIFQTNGGAPYVVRWKNQTIDLSIIGYGTESELLALGMSVDNRVNTSATYQAQKNSPNWWATHPNYSRYNKESAIRTINSLPDTHEYLESLSNREPNYIKFKGIMGSNTDGGAIQDLSPEVITLAVSKGWTVTFV